MSVEITSSCDKYYTVSVSGKLKPSELHALQQAGSQFIRIHGKGSVLVLTDGFEGFGGGKWDHPDIQPRQDSQIEKMAIVGEKRWEELVSMFLGKGFRSVAIEYFLPSELEKAKAWLLAAEQPVQKR
jgi:hypothetical protein